MTETSTFDAMGVPEADGGDKRKIVAGGIAAALALGAGGYFFLLGGSGSSAPVPQGAVAHVVKHSVPVIRKAVAKNPLTTIPAVSTVSLGRDPFRALYIQPVAAPASAPTTATTTTGSTTSTTGSTSGTGTTATAPYSLTLLGVTGSDAKIYAFNVGGTKKSVVAAQKFGKYGELVVLAYVKNSKGVVTGALLQVGDADPITISVGEKLTVQ